MTDAPKLIEEFNKAATKEGLCTDDDHNSTLLLREAVLGGWKDPNI